MANKSKPEPTLPEPFVPATSEEAVEAYRLGAELMRELMKDQAAEEPQTPCPS